MIVTKCVIQFATHHAHITVNHRGVIHVFKQGSRSCDFDVFDETCQLEASDYVMTPPSCCHYYVTFPGETPPHLTP